MYLSHLTGCFFIGMGLLLISSTHVSAQCMFDTSALSIKQRNELQYFWDSLRKAVNNKDKVALAELFHFSFNCSICNTKAPCIAVNKKRFYKEYYKLFFDDYFKERVNIKEILEILRDDFSFDFPIIKPSPKFEGIQGFLTIKEIDNKYKIVAAWAIP